MQNDSLILSKLNDYNLKVNLDMISYLKSLRFENERIVELMSHIVNAHQVWLERISGKSMTFKPFEVRLLDDLILQNQHNFDLTQQYIEGRNLDEKVQYVNLKRQCFENTLTEMFVHLFNHSSYHRGQINQLLVQEGKAAMPSDFILYNRSEIL